MKKKSPAPRALREEVQQLRRDVDLLGIQRQLEELLIRVSRLEAQTEK